MTLHIELSGARVIHFDLSVQSLYSSFSAQLRKLGWATNKRVNSTFSRQEFHADNTFKQRHTHTHIGPRF